MSNRPCRSFSQETIDYYTCYDDEDCSFFERLKYKVECQFQRQKKLYMEAKDKVLHRVNSKFENTLDHLQCFKNTMIDKGSIKIDKTKTRCYEIKFGLLEKGSNGIDEVIDLFEELIIATKTKNYYFTSNVGFNNDLNDFSENVQNSFECKSNQWKYYVENCKQKLVGEINAKKESAIDEYEEIMDSIKNISPPTYIVDFKEGVIDRFDCVVKSCHEFLVSTENHVKYVTNKQKENLADGFENIVDDIKDQIDYINFVLDSQKNKISDIVSDFGDVVGNTRYMLEAKKSAFELNAECVFDDVIDKTKEIASETKQGVNHELRNLDYVISLIEYLLKDFVCFSEDLVGEFAVFSERRVTYYLRKGSEKFRELYAIHCQTSFDNHIK